MRATSGETITAIAKRASWGAGCRAKAVGSPVTKGSLHIEENEVNGIGVACGKGLCTDGTVGVVCTTSDDCGAGGTCTLGSFVTIDKGQPNTSGQLTASFATGRLGIRTLGFRAHYVGGPARFHQSLSDCSDLQIYDAVWPMFLHDPQHTGQSPFDTSADTGTLKWSFATETTFSDPVVDVDGTIYVGSGTSVYAINPDGTEKWSYDTGGPVMTPAIGPDGTVYAVGSPGIANLNAINPDGTEEWSVGVGFHTTTSPMVAPDGTIYVGARFALNAVDPDGTVNWQLYSGDIFGSSSPAVGYDGTIYVGAGYLGLLDAVNPDGNLERTFEATDAGATDSPAVGSDGTIYISSGSLHAIKPDGTEKWDFAGVGVDSSPAVSSNGTIYVGSGTNVYAIGPDGTLNWTFATGNAIYSSPAIGSDGTVYIGSSDGNLYAINSDGTEKWSFTTGGVAGSPAIGSDGTIYITGGTCSVTPGSLCNLYAIH